MAALDTMSAAARPKNVQAPNANREKPLGNGDHSQAGVGVDSKPTYTNDKRGKKLNTAKVARKVWGRWRHDSEDCSRGLEE